MYVRTYVRMYVRTYVRMYVRMYVRTYSKVLNNRRALRNLSVPKPTDLWIPQAHPLFRRPYTSLSTLRTYDFFDFQIFLIFDFWILGFLDFPNFGISVFQIWEIGEIIEKIWKNKFGLKIPLSEAKLSFDTPKGVINARNKSKSTTTNAFSTFSDFLIWDFQIFLIF